MIDLNQDFTTITRDFPANHDKKQDINKRNQITPTAEYQSDS